MKKLMLVLGLGLMIGAVNVNRADGQVHVSVNINVQPAWGPSGYDYAEFYYIPEINVYYDLVHQLFYYHNRGRWISTLFLPVMYSQYDFYSLYKVVLNGVPYPWKYNSRHRRAYRDYCYNYAQVPIYYMKEPRYHHARNNFHGWVESRYMPRNNGRPYSYDYSKNTRNGRIGSDDRSSGNVNRPVGQDRKEAVNGRSSTSTRSSAAANSRSAGNDSQNNRNNTRTDSSSRDKNDRSSSAGSATRSSKSKSSQSESSKKSGRSESSRSTKK
ncbi:MAG: hypothetical protein LBL07_00155 [Tannerella sp.]|jgi:hypothetical protein|nr:hypothetical protein [Tannerella sp.]